jgi:hypothetical protein
MATKMTTDIEKLIERLEKVPIVTLDHHQAREGATIREMMIERAEAAEALRSLMAGSGSPLTSLNCEPRGHRLADGSQPPPDIEKLIERLDSGTRMIADCKDAAEALRSLVEVVEFWKNGNWVVEREQLTARAEKAEAEIERLKQINAGLTLQIQRVYGAS